MITIRMILTIFINMYDEWQKKKKKQIESKLKLTPEIYLFYILIFAYNLFQKENKENNIYFMDLFTYRNSSDGLGHLKKW